MTTFDDATLIAYALGELPPNMAAEVARAAEANEELAAKLDSLGSCVGQSVAPAVATPRRTPTPRSSRRRFLRDLAAGVGGVILIGGAAYAGYELLREKPLVEDNFNDEWLDTRVWETHRGRKGIREEGGYLRLLNRGSLVSIREFPDPIEIELDWQWIDLEGDPLYPDYLTVCLRTSGIHKPKHAYHPMDGIEINFHPHLGGIHVEYNDRDKPVQMSERGVLKFSAGKWYHLRITDDGKRIAVFASGPEIDRKYAKESVLVYENDKPAAERRVSFYNREYVAGANHESRIDNVVIRKLVAK